MSTESNPLPNNSSSSARSIIEVRDLSMRFEKRSGFLKRKKRVVSALQGVGFSVEPGETFGILGANGSGKSTLIRTLSTLLLPSHGSIHILGVNAIASPEQVRPHLGRVSVDAAFYKKLSPRENLRYAARLYAKDTEKTLDEGFSMLKALGVRKDAFGEPLEEMSRGMQQKVAITRALMLNPKILLLDEPTTGLDPRSKREVQKFIRQRRVDTGVTIVLTSHDMQESEELCDRLIFLSHGRNIVSGTPRQIIEKSGKTSLEDAFVHFTGVDITEDEGSENAKLETEETERTPA